MVFAFTIMVPDRTYHASQFVFSSFFLIFLFVPCSGLSWLHVSFLLHVKYSISYRIVLYRIQILITNQTFYCNIAFTVSVSVCSKLGVSRVSLEIRLLFFCTVAFLLPQTKTAYSSKNVIIVCFFRGRRFLKVMRSWEV